VTGQPAVCDTREEQYHLLVLDPTHTRVLAARPARSWLLPFLKFRAQMPEALVFRPYLSRLGVDATPIHEALLRDGCGIDGGDGVDHVRGIAHRYIAFEAHMSDVTADRLTWEPVRDLLDGDAASVIPIQKTALRTCLERFQHAVAPFDSPAQLRDVRHWIHDHLSAIGATITGDRTYYRVRRFDMVAAFPTTSGTMYFKGGPRRMAHEAELTQALHALMPRHFPATLAYDPERHWWLTPSVPGNDLTSAPVSEDVWLAAVKLLAAAQRKAMTSRPVTTALAHRRFGAPQCAAIAMRVRRMLADGPFKEHWSADRLDTLEARLDTAIDRYFSLELPPTWTPADFVGLNIFNDHGHVWFIGVEESYLAPPTLAVSRLFRDLRFRVQAPDPVIERLTDAYIEAWQEQISGDVLRDALTETPACGMLFTLRSHLDRHARHHGLWTSEGEGYPPNTELHAEAHRLGIALLPKASVANSPVLV
jgi:hypothetical protein